MLPVMRLSGRPMSLEIHSTTGSPKTRDVLSRTFAGPVRVIATTATAN